MAVVQNYLQEDTLLIDKIVYELKSQGIFDQFRKECISDVDTKPAYQNLRQRVEGSVSGFLSKQKWSPDMNKNQVREMLRKNIYESGFLETGVERIVDQVVNPKINSVFLPKVTEVVYKFFGIQKNTNAKKEIEQTSTTSVTDLLPTDLEAVSPASDKQFHSIDDQTLDDSKNDDDESPPFEPLDDPGTYVPAEENSVDSHLSGFSGLISHDSNNSREVPKQETSNQDSMMSKQSSEGRLSIVMSDDNDTKMDVEYSKPKNVEVSNNKNDENSNRSSSSSRKDDKKDDRKSSGSKISERSSSSRRDRYRKHDKDRKGSKYNSKDSDKNKDRERKESSSRNGKSDHKNDKEKGKSHSSSSSSSHRHKDSSSHRSHKDSSKDRTKDKSGDKDKSDKDKYDKDKNRDKKESSSRDKNKDKSHSKSTSHSDSKDKYKRDDRHSSKSSSKHKDKKDSKSKEKSSESDPCNVKKRTDRRSTDRDSNDGHSNVKTSSSSFDSFMSSHVSQQGKGQESNSNSNTGSGDSGNSDVLEETNVVVLNDITDEVSIPQSIKLKKPSFALNFSDAKRLMKIRKEISKLEKERAMELKLENENKSKTIDEPANMVPNLESPPLPTVAVSAASWDALEAKLNERIARDYEAVYDSPDTPEKNYDSECHYFETECNLKTERYVKFVSDLVGKLERNIEKTLVNVSSEDGKMVSTSKVPMKTSLKRKLELQSDYESNKRKFSIEVHESFSLPLSPAESDNSVDKKSDISESSEKKNDESKKSNDAIDKVKRKIRAPAVKQRYTSEDLYKPRPLISGSRRRSGRTTGPD